MRSSVLIGLLFTALDLAMGSEIPDALPRIDSLLVLEPVSSAGRSPVFTDPLELSLAKGTWRPPEPGERVEPAQGPARTWRTLGPDEEGRFVDPALRGGYAVARFDWPAEEVLLLEARGHRHVYVNGVPRAGDVYDLGFVSLPIQLRKGQNVLLFRAGRGRLKLAWARPPAPVFLGERDLTLPHPILGEEGPWWVGIPLANATGEWQRGLMARVVVGAETGPALPLPQLAPLSLLKIPLPVAFRPGANDQRIRVGLELLEQTGSLLHRREIELEARPGSTTHRRTFVSGIDGSIQYFGVTPPAAWGSDPLSLFLTLHGAGVEALAQAGSYAPKPGGVVVAPTNRRPFGFDWEDWGRLDALEVLAEARRLYPVDPHRIYLTGHSMGGHGTWSLGVHFPDLFAAIAPSAGWRDFWSYGGAVHWQTPDPVEEILARAMNGSRTLLLESNLRHHGIYLLHGDADTNVPVSEARFMRERLAKFHANWAYFEKPGAGHWWGKECVDWPPLFDFLSHNQGPRAVEVDRVQFVAVHPGISASCHWVSIRAQERPFAPSSVDATLRPEPPRLLVRTENVAVLGLDPPAQEPDRLHWRRPLAVDIDGQGLEELDWPETGALLLERVEGLWRPWIPGVEERPSEKSPERAGPFKDAFRRRMLFVFGTGGNAQERSWALGKARYDAETFWYRGNGAVEIVPDTAYAPERFPRRNVILYGNAETNSAWAKLLDPACPISVGAGRLQVGQREFEGEDLACLFVYPHRERGWTETLVGVVAGTGPVGMRLTHQLPYFVSGVAYPDWTVLGADMLEKGSQGVRGAGFFDRHWR